MRLRHLLLGVLLVVAALIAVEVVVSSLETRSYQSVDEGGDPPGAGTFIHQGPRKEGQP